jgi:hypothetical protein
MDEAEFNRAKIRSFLTLKGCRAKDVRRGVRV